MLACMAHRLSQELAEYTGLQAHVTTGQRWCNAAVRGRQDKPHRVDACLLLGLTWCNMADVYHKLNLTLSQPGCP